jgi:hypothetical protein
MAMAAVTTMAATVSSTSPAPAPTGSPIVEVVEVPDDDVLPPGWDQWASLPTSAPESPAGALVMREDDCVMAGRPAHGTEASSSHAALLTSSGPTASPEWELERVDASSAHFTEAQAEHELWEELNDHGASLNWVLNEALQIHSGPAWCVFRVRGCLLNFVILLPLLLLRPCFS